MTISDSKFNSIIKSPVTEKNLYMMPFYTGQSFSKVTPDMIHKSYHPDVSISNLILNIRSIKLLEQAGISKIGELLLQDYTKLLQYRNCGIHTIGFLRSELKKYIVDKEIDYSRHWTDIESMIDNAIDIKERNLIILKQRLGISLPKPFTLEECGNYFGITREAVRQIMVHVEEIITHPETEYRLRPFWVCIDKLLKKREVWTSEELAKKVRINLNWQKKPETHALESFLAIKQNKYFVSYNGLVGFRESRCLNCPRIEGFLPEIMKDKSELSYSKVYELFLEKFEEFCPLVNKFPQKVIAALVKLHVSLHLRHYRQYQMRNNRIIDILTYVPKRRRAR